MRDIEDKELKDGITEKHIFSKETPTDSLTLIQATIETGKSCGLHKHSIEEAFVFIRGKGKGKVGNKKVGIEPGTVIYVPVGVPHNFTCTGNTPLVTIASLSNVVFETTWLNE
jgi:mannose-6-phosphate isomerase-like protein (cupin superfamily)